MKALRLRLLTLVALVAAALSAAAQDLMVSVSAIQPTLPPQAMLYVNDPGNYFNVSLINPSGETQNVYLVMDLEQIDPASGLYVKIPPRYQPDRPISVAAGATRILNRVELKTLFNHVPSDHIATTPGLFSDYQNGAFGLLPEGQYRVRLMAYRWEPGRDDPVAVSAPSGGQCIFNVCYRAQSPAFLTPMPASGDASGVCSVDKANPLFTWREPVVACNPSAARFTYTLKVVQLVDGQQPDDAISHNPSVYERGGLLSPLCVLPQERVRHMVDGATYVARVTAEQTGLAATYLNYALIENQGHSDLRLFRLASDTPPAPVAPADTTRADDADEFDFGFDTSGTQVTDSLYTFRNPQLTEPSFSVLEGARKRFAGEDIQVKWRRAWFVGGAGQRQDTVSIAYDVELFKGSPDQARADIFASEPVFTHQTHDLADSIPWQAIADRVTLGDYLVLRVRPTSENVQSVAFVSDSLNVVDFALSKRFSKQLFVCSNAVEITNERPTGKTAKELRGAVVALGQYQLTLDEVKKNDKGAGFSGTGRVAWKPLGTTLMVKVAFDSLCINTDNIVYAGTARGVKDDAYKANNGEMVDKLFSDWGIDNLIGDTSIPYAKMLQGEISKRGRDVAKQLNLGKYYDYYHRAKDFLAEGRADDLVLPLKLPKQVNKTPADLQIVNMTFAPEWAAMDLMGTFTLPESSHLDNHVLVLGAPHLCISPDRLLPESGAICLLSDMAVKEPSSGFMMTFKAPDNIAVIERGDAPTEGCYIHWQADTLAMLQVDIDIAVPGLKKEVDGKATGELPVLNIKTGISDWDDWTAEASMDAFQVADLPGWTFAPGHIIYDHSLVRNAPAMGAFPKAYDKAKAGITAGDDNTWTGLYIDRVAVKFPKALEVGSGGRRLELAATGMFFDRSGATLDVGADQVLRAETGRLGGWKFSVDAAGASFLQNDFSKCYFRGTLRVPIITSDIDYVCNIYNQHRVNREREGYAYVFKVQQVEDANFDFILAKAQLTQEQTYFLLEAEDQPSGDTQTRMELSMGGQITIGGAETMQKELDKLPLRLSIPGVHFTKMRIANCPAWESAYDEDHTQQKAHEAQEAEMRRAKWKTLHEAQEHNFGTEQAPVYFDMGEWSLASAEKKLGPFTFALQKYAFGRSGKNMTLDIEGKIGLLDSLVVATAGVQLQAQVTHLDDLSNLSLEYKDCLFQSVEVSSNLPGITISGRLDVVRPDGKSQEKGYSGTLKFALPGNLFTFESYGGYFDHKEEGNRFTWGYFHIEAGSAVGLQMPPIELKDINGGFYFNCAKDKNDATKATPQNGVIGVTAGLGIAATGGDNVIGGQFDFTVVYDKKHKRLTTFLLEGDIEAMASVVKAGAKIVYQNDEESKYFRINVTVDATADGLADKVAGEVGRYTDALRDSELLQSMRALNDKVKGEYDNLVAQAGLDNLHQEHEEDGANESSPKSDKESSFKAKAGVHIALDFAITWRDKGVDYDKAKWHVYLGKPQKADRCSFTLIDLKTGIVNVKIGADAYFCAGNELPDNGALPDIPANIRSFLTGKSGANGVKSADAGKAERARRRAVEEFRANATGGVMLGASVWGYIDVDLGILYADMGAEAGFDISITHIGEEVYCIGSKGPAGWHGWYGEGQLYAYLAAKMGLRLNLGFWKGSVDLVDAGIGGVLQMGMPNPSYFTGDLRMKLRLLGGLINFNRRFQFDCGKKCDIFYGNALDDFELWGDTNIGFATKQEGWSDKNILSPDITTDIAVTPQARLDEPYAILDQTDLHIHIKQIDAEKEQLEATSTRTFRFNPSTDQAVLYEYSDTTKNAVKRVFDLQVTATRVSLKNARHLNPNRYYELVFTGNAKELRRGEWHDPETYYVDKGKYIETPWEQSKHFYFRTGDRDEVKDGGDLAPYVALAYPSDFNQIQSDREVTAYAADIKSPSIVLKENDILRRLYSNGFLTWKLKQGDKVMETQRAGTDGNKLAVTFDTDVRPGANYSIIVDYERERESEEKEETTKTLSMTEAEFMAWYPSYKRGQPDDILGYPVREVVGVEKWYARKLTVSNPSLTQQGKQVSNLSDKLNATMRGPAMTAQPEPPGMAAQAGPAVTRKSPGRLNTKVPAATVKTTTGSTLTVRNLPSSPTTGTSGASSSSVSTANGSLASAISDISSRGFRQNQQKQQQEEQIKSDPILTDKGSPYGEDVEVVAYYHVTFKTLVSATRTEVETIANVVSLRLLAVEGDWTTGHNGENLDYERPFIGIKPMGFEYDYTPVSNVTDHQVGYGGGPNQQYCYPGTTQPLAYYDPYYYIGYLSNWAFIGGWEVDGVRISNGVTTTQSLTYSDLGGNYAGYLPQGDANYNITTDWKRIRDNALFASGASQTFPLPRLDDDRYDYVDPAATFEGMPQYIPAKGDDSEANRKRAMGVLQNMADVYRMAETLDGEIHKTAREVLDKGGVTFKTSRANEVEEWNLQHLGMDLSVSRQDATGRVKSLKVPYYQFALIWGGIIENHNSGKKVALNSVLKGAGKRATPRQNQKESRQVLFSLLGVNLQGQVYKRRSFNANAAMKRLKSAKFQYYRMDSYHPASHSYGFSQGSVRAFTLNDPLKGLK